MNTTKMARWMGVGVAALVMGASMSPSAYVLQPWKWNTVHVPFYVNPQNLDVSQAAAIAAIQAGAASWSTQSNTAFTFSYAGQTSGSTLENNGKNEVFFRNSSNGSAVATTYTWTSGGAILDSDIVFWDGAYRFYTGSSGCSGGFYIEDVAAHEFGHALGLDHSPVENATMYYGVRYCGIDMRWLAEDDKQAAEYLYPAGVVNTRPWVTIASPAAGASVGEGTIVTFSGSAGDEEDGSLSSRIVWSSSRDGQIGVGDRVDAVLTVGDHVVKATATDYQGATTEAQRTLTVKAASTVPPPSGLQLSARGYKVKGQQQVDLSWSGAGSLNVVIYRNDAVIATTGNDGRHTDALNKKGAGVYTYKVCEAGTSVCSGVARVTF